LFLPRWWYKRAAQKWRPVTDAAVVYGDAEQPP